MMELIASRHSIRENFDIFELRENGELVAALYPTDDGLKIVSKFIVNHPSLIAIEVQQPPALLIDFRPGMAL